MIILRTNPTIAKGLEKSVLVCVLSHVNFVLLKFPEVQEH